MVKCLAILIGSSIGGAIGWWMGAMVGQVTAYMLSLVGRAVGLHLR
jgi:membrane protein YqaA with SNARE-associated domain